MTGPAVPPGGEELREAIGRAIYNEGAYCGDCPYDGWEFCSECRRVCKGYADAVLALPEMRDALAAQQKLRRGRPQHQPVPAVDVGPGGEYPRDMCSCGESYYDDCDVRRLLDGDS